MTAAILVTVAGYSVLSYGIVLLRGYDITLGEWFNPLKPYQWPSGAVPTVPAGKIFP